MNLDLVRQLARAANLLGCLICLPAAWRIGVMAFGARHDPAMTPEMRTWLLWLSVAVFIMVGIGGTTWGVLLFTQVPVLSQWPAYLSALTTFALDGALYALLSMGRRR